MFRNIGKIGKKVEKTVREEAHRVEKKNRPLLKGIVAQFNLGESPETEHKQTEQQDTAESVVIPTADSVAVNENKIEHTAESVTDLNPYFFALLDNYLDNKEVSCYIFYNENEQDNELRNFNDRLINDLQATHKVNVFQKGKPKLGVNMDEYMASALQKIVNADYIIPIATKQGLERYQQVNSSNQTSLQEPQSIYAIEYENSIQKFKSGNGQVIPILYNGTAQECLPANLRACSLVYTDLSNTPNVEGTIVGDYYHNFIQLMDSFGLIDNNNVSILNEKWRC